MGKINWGRALVGGLVAGFVYWAMEYVLFGYVFAADLDPPPGLTGPFGMKLLTWYFLTDLLYGQILVTLYTFVRPRLGAGPKSAAIAGVMVWMPASLMRALTDAPLGITPIRVYVLTTSLSLLMFPLAAIAGARFYTEPS